MHALLYHYAKPLCHFHWVLLLALLMVKWSGNSFRFGLIFQIVCICACVPCRPQEIDEAARRRLVKRLYIPLPDFLARKQIVTNLLRQQSFSLTAEELDLICQQSDGMCVCVCVCVCMWSHWHWLTRRESVFLVWAFLWDVQNSLKLQ